VAYNHGRNGGKIMSRKTLIIILLGMLLVFSGCSPKGEKPIGDNKDQIPGEVVEEPDENTEEEEEIDEIQKIVDDMTIDEKIGQLFIFGLEGTELDENVIKAIEENHIGGFIFFKNNIVNAGQAVKLLNGLKERNSSNRLPLFLAVDEEGGIVSRLSDIYLDLPSARTIGNVNDEKISLEYGKVLGERVKELGFNMNFAPVLDVNSNPKNPVIGKRAFGTEVGTVAKHGLKVMEGINSNNVISVVKHFPGHGDTSTDSHIGLPVIDKSLKQMENLELIPFARAIEKDVDAIMVAHILFTQLDGENPATLSPKVISELLREELSFDGVVISDDMTMGAITENYTIEEASYKFLKAGGDILLICHEYENQIKALSRIKEEVEKGNISEQELNDKVYRIVKLKMKYALEDLPVEHYNVAAVNSHIQELLKKINP
jgi:beta-N-acetylhexosaminidase